MPAPAVLFPLGACLQVFANPPHILDRSILGLENPSSRVGDRNGELESVIGCIPEFAVPIESKPNLLTLDQLFQSHRHPLQNAHLRGWRARADLNCHSRFKKTEALSFGRRAPGSPTPTRTGIPGLGNPCLLLLDDGAQSLNGSYSSFPAIATPRGRSVWSTSTDWACSARTSGSRL